MKIKVKVTVTEETELEITEDEFKEITAVNPKTDIEGLFVADIWIGREDGISDKVDIGGNYKIELIKAVVNEEELLERYIACLREDRKDHFKGPDRNKTFRPMSYQEWKDSWLNMRENPYEVFNVSD
jgi:hypothetical protein